MSSFFSLALLLLSESPASPVDIRVVPEAELFTAVVTGPLPANASGGAFSGAVSLNGSPTELPMTGSARVSGDRLEVSLKVKYKDVPEDWANRFRPADFAYNLRGRLAGGGEIAWSGTKRWNQIAIEGKQEVASGFVKLGAIRLTKFSLFESEGLAEVTVRNPLAFPLKVASTSYGLTANGRPVGSGSTTGMLLRAEQSTTLTLPIELDHSELLGAAGSAVASGGDVLGKLKGTLVVRMPGGDIVVPLDLTGHLSLR